MSDGDDSFRLDALRRALPATHRARAHRRRPRRPLLHGPQLRPAPGRLGRPAPPVPPRDRGQRRAISPSTSPRWSASRAPSALRSTSRSSSSGNTGGPLRRPPRDPRGLRVRRARGRRGLLRRLPRGQEARAPGLRHRRTARRRLQPPRPHRRHSSVCVPRPTRSLSSSTGSSARWSSAPPNPACAPSTRCSRTRAPRLRAQRVRPARGTPRPSSSRPARPRWTFPRTDWPANHRFVGPLLPAARHARRPRSRSPTSSTASRRPWSSRREPSTTATPRSCSSRLSPRSPAADHLVVACTGRRHTATLRARFPHDNVVVEDWVDFDALLPRADLFISNGGYGSIMHALMSEVPVLSAGKLEGQERHQRPARLSRLRPGPQDRAPQTPVRSSPASSDVLGDDVDQGERRACRCRSEGEPAARDDGSRHRLETAGPPMMQQRRSARGR